MSNDRTYSLFPGASYDRWKTTPPDIEDPTEELLEDESLEEDLYDDDPFWVDPPDREVWDGDR